MGYFLVTLFPVLGFFKIHYRVFSPVADHLQYIAMIGIIALVTGGAVYLYDKSHMRMRQSIGITGTEAAHESLRTALAYGASVKIYQRLLFIASVLVVGTLGVMSWQQQHIYKDAETLWNDNLSRNPNSWVAYYNLGLIYFKKGLYDQAISDYTKALEINPVNAKAYNNRGNVYYKKGLYDLAISDYDKAIEIDPGFAKAYNNRGAAYKDKGLYDRAMFDYDKAIEIDPRFAEAYFNKAIACEKAGHIQKAIEAYKGFIQYAPPQYASYIERVRQRVKELEK
jgi:tetratricopeptide (TPR) repeat protein